MSDDSISDISDKVYFEDNKEIEKNIFSKKINTNKKNSKKNTVRSKSVILDDRNKNYSEKYSIDLIEKSNAKLNELAEKIKREAEEVNYKLQKEINVKELISITRKQLRNEFINVYENEMQKIIRDIPTELKKDSEEIKEDSNEIDNSDNSNSN